jgi:hypothetical protein
VCSIFVGELAREGRRTTPTKAWVEFGFTIAMK